MAVAKKAVRQGSRARVAAPGKAGAGASDEAGPPIHVRNFGLAINSADHDRVRRRLARRLARFGASVERASVRIEDVNGPRGGLDKRCRIKIVLSGVPSVTVEEQHGALLDAIDGALRRASIAVQRAVGRRSEDKPLPRRRHAASVRADDWARAPERDDEPGRVSTPDAGE